LPALCHGRLGTCLACVLAYPPPLVGEHVGRGTAPAASAQQPACRPGHRPGSIHAATRKPGLRPGLRVHDLPSRLARCLQATRKAGVPSKRLGLRPPEGRMAALRVVKGLVESRKPGTLLPGQPTAVVGGSPMGKPGFRE